MKIVPKVNEQSSEQWDLYAEDSLGRMLLGHVSRLGGGVVLRGCAACGADFGKPVEGCVCPQCGYDWSLALRHFDVEGCDEPPDDRFRTGLDYQL
jgi:hypothetical protein